jgi:hypothetical protein
MTSPIESGSNLSKGKKGLTGISKKIAVGIMAAAGATGLVDLASHNIKRLSPEEVQKQEDHIRKVHALVDLTGWVNSKDDNNLPIDPEENQLSSSRKYEPAIKEIKSLAEYDEYFGSFSLDEPTERKKFGEEMIDPDDILIKIIDNKKDIEVRKAALLTLVAREKRYRQQNITKAVQNPDMKYLVDPNNFYTTRVVEELQKYLNDPDLGTVAREELEKIPK